MKNEVTKQVALFDDSKRAVANLMARENISVQVVDGAATASFDPVNRVLTLPAFVTMTTEQVDTLTAHEIGHALFSDNSLYEKIANEPKSLFTYLNVVEDARIERKMRECFPGLSRVFYTGYQQFFTTGPIFQGNAQGLINPANGQTKPFAEFRLIDRINIYFKTGAFCTVPFSAEEKVWINRIAKCSSMDEALEIAKALHKLAKESKKQEPKQNPSNSQEQKSAKAPQGQPSDESNEDDKSSQDSQPSDETEESDETSDDKSATEEGETTSEPAEKNETEETDENANESKGSDEADSDETEETDETDGDEAGDEATDDENESDDASAGAGAGAGAGDGDVEEAETDQNAAQELQKQAQKNQGQRAQVRNLLLAPVSDSIFAARTVSAKDWSDKAYTNFAKLNSGYAAVLDLLDAAWTEKFGPTVQHMSLEFERRKTAKNMVNARIGKTGKLNMSKLAGYKFSDDLFLRSMTIPNGKSHGVVMVVDASGSMSDCFASVLDQVLLFAKFAFQVNIPFEAYMFTDQTADGGWCYGSNSPTFRNDGGLHTIALSDHGILVGLVNTRTDRSGFKKQVRTCLAFRHMFARDCETVSYSADITSGIPYRSLGGTPLYTGVMLGEKALANMKRQNRLDKTTFVVVTDGQDGGGLQYKTNDLNQYTGKLQVRNASVEETAIVVRDTVTKKNFTFVDMDTNYAGNVEASLPDNAVITLLLDVIKLRHSARTVYLYLESDAAMGGGYSYRRRRRSARRTISTRALGYLSRATKQDEVAAVSQDVVKKAIKDDGQYVLPKDCGVADLSIVLRTSSLRMDENAFTALKTDDMTQKTVAKEFTKAMVKATSNRVFVNTVIPHLI